MIKVNGQEIKFTKFPNGETNMNHNSFPVTGFKQEIEVDFKYEEDGDLIKLMFVKRYLDESQVNLIYKLNIYYLPYSRMDRSEDGSPFTLKYVSKFINDLNFDEVVLIEPHSNVSPALIDSSYSNYINFELINKVADEIGFDVEKDYIMFPDVGASARYKNMKFNNVLIGHKDRDFVTGKIKKLDLVGDISNVEGKKAIICDDLSSYGGTFIYSSQALKAIGIKEVYLLVGHAENSIFKKSPSSDEQLFDHIDKVFTTDSILTEQDHWQNAKFKDQLKIYKMEDILND